MTLTGAHRPTTSASSATTSTGARARASPRRARTGSASRAVRASLTPALLREPSTTRWRPRTPPGMSQLRRATRRRSSPTRLPRRSLGPRRQRRGHNRLAHLERLNGQHRRRALRRLPWDDRGVHAERRNRIAQPTGNRLHGLGPRAPTTTRSRPKTRPATPARPRTRRRTSPTTPPSERPEPDGHRRGRTGDALLGGSDRQRGRDQVRRLPLDDLRIHPGADNRIAQPTGTSYTDGPRPRHVLLPGQAEDAAGNVGRLLQRGAATVTANSTAVSITAPTGGTLSGVRPSRRPRARVRASPGCSSRSTARTSEPRTRRRRSRSWDTRGELNGSHTLTAVARDTAGNTAASAPVVVTVSNAGVSTAGLQAAYGFDDGPRDTRSTRRGTTAPPPSWARAGRPPAATAAPSRLTARRRVDPPALGTFYKTGFTLEAWVYKQTSKKDVGDRRHLDGGGGPMIWVDHINGALRAHARQLARAPTSTRASRPRSAAGSTSPRPTTARPRASTSTGPGRQLDVHRQRRRLEHWRIGAYGSSAGRLLRRPDRQRADLRPRAERERDPDRHGVADPARPNPPTVTRSRPPTARPE